MPLQAIIGNTKSNIELFEAFFPNFSSNKNALSQRFLKWFFFFFKFSLYLHWKRQSYFYLNNLDSVSQRTICDKYIQIRTVFF